MRAVIALGGNALVREGQEGYYLEQVSNLSSPMKVVAGLAKKKWKLLITHGNGPQVGTLLLQQPHTPFFGCVAQTQASIGSAIQEALYPQLERVGVKNSVTTVITHVVVNGIGLKPTKPVGFYYHSESGLPKKWVLKKFPKGWRRVVSSPRPENVLEEDIIKSLFGKTVLVAGGGGGIPVLKRPHIHGVEGVIDKDLTAALLGSITKAELMVILTDINYVYLNYGRPGQKALRKVSREEVADYLKQGHFQEGTMEPKIRASLDFLENGGKKVIICHIDNFKEGVEKGRGTIIT